MRIFRVRGRKVDSNAIFSKPGVFLAIFHVIWAKNEQKLGTLVFRSLFKIVVPHKKNIEEGVENCFLILSSPR